MKAEKKNIKHLSLRIDDELLYKFHVICSRAKRSANKQMLSYIKNAVLVYEKEYGKINYVEKKK